MNGCHLPLDDDLPVRVSVRAHPCLVDCFVVALYGRRGSLAVSGTGAQLTRLLAELATRLTQAGCKLQPGTVTR